MHKEVLHDLYLLSVVQTSTGLHILPAEYNCRHHHHHHHHHYHHHHHTHGLGYNRPISVSSNSLFKGLPSRLRPFGLLFNIIFGILLLITLMY